MIRQKIQSVYYRLLYLLQGNGGQPDRLLFIGTDQGWEQMAEITRRAGKVPIRCTADASEGGHLTMPELALTCNYAVYQTDAPGCTFARILQLMQEGSEKMQMWQHLGTFSLRTKTLILPDETLQ